MERISFVADNPTVIVWTNTLLCVTFTKVYPLKKFGKKIKRRSLKTDLLLVLPRNLQVFLFSGQLSD